MVCSSEHSDRRTMAESELTKESLSQITPRKHNVRGVIFALCGGIGWGFSGACAQNLFDGYGLDPLWISSVRMLLAGLLLCVFALIVKRGAFLRLWRSPKDLVWLFVVAIAGLAFCQITYLFAIKYSNAGTATVIQYIAPVMIVLFLCFKGGRAPLAKEVLAMFLVVGGYFPFSYAWRSHHNGAFSRRALLGSNVGSGFCSLYASSRKTDASLWKYSYCGKRIACGWNCVLAHSSVMDNNSPYCS